MKKRFVMKVEHIAIVTDDSGYKEKRVNCWGVFDKKLNKFVAHDNGDLIKSYMEPIRDRLNEIVPRLEKEGKVIKDIVDGRIYLGGDNEGDWVNVY